MATRKYHKKSYKSKNKFRKTRSKRGGNGSDVKLAIILITTHGMLDVTEKKIEHKDDINVYKINATIPGVCNYIEDDELLDMGNKINGFIKSRKKKWVSRKILHSSSSQLMDLNFKSPKLAQLELGYLTQSLSSFLHRIDGVHKETRGKIKHTEPGFLDPNDPDENQRQYIAHSDEAYKSYRWGQGDTYLDKTYMIIPEERVDKATNFYNNTVLILGESEFKDSVIVDMRYNLRGHLHKKWNDGDDDDNKNKYMQLSEILSELKTKGYTDTIIIDLSCSSGEDERNNRHLIMDNKNRERHEKERHERSIEAKRRLDMERKKRLGLRPKGGNSRRV